MCIQTRSTILYRLFPCNAFSTLPRRKMPHSIPDLLPVLSVSHFCLFPDTALRILQINSLHLKYWDLDHWTSRGCSVVPENLQSHRLCYTPSWRPCTFWFPTSIFAKQHKNFRVSGSLQLWSYIVPQTFYITPWFCIHTQAGSTDQLHLIHGLL